MGTTKITAEPGLPYIDMSREFDAPRDLVYRAFTDPGSPRRSGSGHAA